MAPIVLVDDEKLVVDFFEDVLRERGITNLVCATDPTAVPGLIQGREVAGILLDLNMPGLPGVELLRWIVAEKPDTPVVVVSATSSLDTVVECMRLGAADYVAKPVDATRLVTTVEGLIETWSMRRENTALRERLMARELENPAAFAEIVSEDPGMRSLMLYVEAVARTASTVLITGATGTGKELVARALHLSSGRKGKQVSLNVASLDDAMFSDTLFGHVKGAFTGADQPRAGLIETAAAGTLFLDEIGELPPAAQVKLLRLLEGREYYPVGSDTPRTSTARVVVATNRDLRTEVEAGTFRRDLYYRLQSHQVHIPPLSERRGDIRLLADRFLDAACAEAGKQRPEFPEEAYALLETYGFPGNVRELRSMVGEAVSLLDTAAVRDTASSRAGGRGRVLTQVFRARTGLGVPLRRVESPDGPPVTIGKRFPTLREVTEYIVAEALRRGGDSQRAAAELLGITPQALSKRLLRRKGAPDADPV